MSNLQNELWVVTVNWKQPIVTRQCVKSIQNNGVDDSHIVIVDNGSADSSVNLFRETFPSIKVIETGKNFGFSGGFNKGIKHALSRGADYVFMINNDTELPPGMIGTFLSVAKDLHADISSPLIYYGDRPELLWSAGGYFCKLLSMPLDSHRRNKSIPTNPIKREFLTGCALLIHKNVFEQIGFFNEDFFLYYEDMDFLKRANNAGLQIWLIPQARLLHYESISSQGLESEKVVYWMAYSNCRYFKKHAMIWQWLFIIPWQALRSLKRIASFISRRKSNLIRPYLLGLLSINPQKYQRLYSN